MKKSATLTLNIRQIAEAGTWLDGELPPEIFAAAEDEQLSWPNPLGYQLHAALVHGGVLVQGQLQTVLRCRCDRCLRYFDSAAEVPEFCLYLEDPLPDIVELTDHLREDVLLVLPQKSLCQPDCQGLCPQCGQNLNVRACDCDQQTQTADVWHQLDDLKL